MLFYGIVKALADLLSERNKELTLDRAALLLASVEFPNLDPGPYLQLLDSYAVELAGKLSSESDGREYVEVTNRYLFDELGFAGNTADYYNLGIPGDDESHSGLNAKAIPGGRRTAIPG